MKVGRVLLYMVSITILFWGDVEAYKTNVFTDKYADECGFSKGIVYFDSNGKRTNTEYSHTGKYTDKYGIVKSIYYNDSRGKTTKKEQFFIDILAPAYDRFESVTVMPF